MKIAHLAIATPGRCGLYETTRELVVGLRALGMDSRICDPTEPNNTLHPGFKEDRGAPIEKLAWARETDLFVNHSGFDGCGLDDCKQPFIHICHGRPMSSYLMSQRGGAPVFAYHDRLNKDERCKAVVTFWREHARYHQVMFPDKKVAVIPAPVDLKAWSMDGPKGYGFSGKRGGVNVVCTDPWRDDVDPFEATHAFALWARQSQFRAKLHFYGVPADEAKRRAFAPLWKRLEDDGTLGEIKPWVNGLDNVYRAADLMITGNVIETRSKREAMACGCPVVHADVGNFGGFYEALNKSRFAVREEAERRFDPARTAQEFARVIE